MAVVFSDIAVDLDHLPLELTYIAYMAQVPAEYNYLKRTRAVILTEVQEGCSGSQSGYFRDFPGHTFSGSDVLCCIAESNAVRRSYGTKQERGQYY